ncbi:MAG: AbrB/MazE/SpoVT family DNA-binding domain-containing protein [Candidatus Thermoplasmatota archaeon]|nr:AbrB/MazE/SpoVT family DNA-binding domain-containing protein [Candidatus Thermoplasmatota archaeon]
MEIRRVQITGGSSYVITLPKEWIKNLHIQKNDPLGINVQSDGTLLLTPKMTQQNLERIKEFDVSQIPQPTYLLQRLIGAYIAGYTSLKIISSSRMPTAVQNVIRSFTQLAIGPEVVEETDTAILLKDLLKPTEMPLDRTIKRMQIIVKGMYEDVMRSLQNRDTALAEQILSRDDDVDRLHWLVARQYNILLQNISLAGTMNITIDMASTCFLISRIIERIGDHVVRIAQNVPTLIDNDLDQTILDKIQTASGLASEIFNTSIHAFFKKDLKSSHGTIESVIELETLCGEINTLALQQQAIVAISVGYIIESIRRIGEYAEDISENVINYLI